MRWFVRFIVLALAAFGAKALYDMLAPHRDELQQTGSDFAARTMSATQEVVGRASEAAQRIASTAQENAAGIRDVAVQQAHEVKSAAGDARRGASEVLGAESEDVQAGSTS